MCKFCLLCSELVYTVVNELLAILKKNTLPYTLVGPLV